MRWYLIVVLICISLMMLSIFMFYILSLEKCLDLLPSFDQVVWFLLLSCMSYLCILVINFLLVMHTCQPSHFSHVWLFVTPGTVACQAPLSMVFSRQKYRSGLPCPPPGDLSDPGIKPMAPSLQVDSLPAEPPGQPLVSHILCKYFLPLYGLPFHWIYSFPCFAKACFSFFFHLVFSFVYFCFISVALGDWPKKTLVWFMSENALPILSSRSFIVPCLNVEVFKASQVYFWASSEGVF